jgi:hypothetical protein
MSTGTITNIRSARQGFTKVPHGFLDGVPRRCRPVLLELMGAAPGFHPTFSLLAKKTGYSRRAVYYQMAHLQKTGCISEVGTDARNRRIWRIHEPEERAAMASGGDPKIVHMEGAHSEARHNDEGAHLCTKKGAHLCTPNKTKNNINSARPSGGAGRGRAWQNEPPGNLHPAPVDPEPGPPPRIDKPAIAVRPDLADWAAELRTDINNRRGVSWYEAPLSPT